MVANVSVLKVSDHSRDSSGMEYVYPVVSRRAAGLSIGVNLNPNNACNWRCVYCQVPDLTRGSSPAIDLIKLKGELSELLQDVVHGDFLERRLIEGSRGLMDVAFSGNGEPTSATDFLGAVDCVGQVLERFGLLGKLPVRLITNGSLIDRTRVQEALKHLAGLGGEVWFKVDGLTPTALARTNNTRTTPAAVLRRLHICAELCPTWVQSCFFALDGQQPAANEVDAYVEGIGRAAESLLGVHLYGLARPSCQPEASRLGRLSEGWFAMLEQRLKEKGLTVTVSP